MHLQREIKRHENATKKKIRQRLLELKDNCYQSSVLIIMPLWKNQMNQGLVKDYHFLPVISKQTFLMVMSEELPKAKYSGHTTCPCFQGTPNSRAVHAQEILKFFKSDLCKCFASNTTSYIWMRQLKNYIISQCNISCCYFKISIFMADPHNHTKHSSCRIPH